MRMSYLRIIFLILFCLLHLEYIFALASDRTWTQEVFLDKRDIPYSVFSIKLKIDNNNTVEGELCSIVDYGNKIDCPIFFTSKLINNEIKINFDSTFGGKNGIAIITLQEKNLNWHLLTNPNGEYSFAKKAKLLPEKIQNK